MTDEPKRRGRPPKGEMAKRGRVCLRVTNATKAKLQAAAAENGRCVSEEIEARIDRSFDREEWSAELVAELRAFAKPPKMTPIEWDAGSPGPITVTFSKAFDS